MTTAAASPAMTQLIVRRMVNASRERVWAVMSDPTLMPRWFNGGEAGMSSITGDIRTGGKYHGSMVEAGRSYALEGDILEVVPPRLMRLSWRAGADEKGPLTEVSLELFERGAGQTEIILTHHLPAVEALIKSNRNGWTWALSRLSVHSEIETAPVPANPGFAGGVNIALKVPPHVYAQTVAFYRDVLDLPALACDEISASFTFGGCRLHVDKVATQTHTDVWLEINTPDVKAAEAHFRRHRVARRDEVEQLPPGFAGFWVASPAGTVHLVAQ